MYIDLKNCNIIFGDDFVSYLYNKIYTYLFCNDTVRSSRYLSLVCKYLISFRRILDISLRCLFLRQTKIQMVVTIIICVIVGVSASNVLLLLSRVYIL